MPVGRAMAATRTETELAAARAGIELVTALGHLHLVRSGLSLLTAACNAGAHNVRIKQWGLYIVYSAIRAVEDETTELSLAVLQTMANIATLDDYLRVYTQCTFAQKTEMDALYQTCVHCAFGVFPFDTIMEEAISLLPMREKAKELARLEAHSRVPHNQP